MLTSTYSRVHITTNLFFLKNGTTHGLNRQEKEEEKKIDWCLINGLWEQAYETTSGSPSKAIGTTRRPAISGGQNGYRRDER